MAVGECILEQADKWVQIQRGLDIRENQTDRPARLQVSRMRMSLQGFILKHQLLHGQPDADRPEDVLKMIQVFNNRFQIVDVVTESRGSVPDMLISPVDNIVFLIFRQNLMQRLLNGFGQFFLWIFPEILQSL